MARLNKKRQVNAGKTVAEQRVSLHPVHSGNLKHQKIICSCPGHPQNRARILTEKRLDQAGNFSGGRGKFCARHPLPGQPAL
ncbi:hypothetical protein [Pseudomonas anguilliseptica]|uniref:hypothetical protein n=1 Tax=Pseudomonas anguilliseptica TaxID=53406 RepID=UPI0022B02069|nr:hypothetical protein [Pseudomonas anguilliseptica]MCZ4323506.1 hypothetical protein [Pseudomonas anguilliseptica]